MGGKRNWNLYFIGGKEKMNEQYKNGWRTYIDRFIEASNKGEIDTDCLPDTVNVREEDDDG